MRHVRLVDISKLLKHKACSGHGTAGYGYGVAACVL